MGSHHEKALDDMARDWERDHDKQAARITELEAEVSKWQAEARLCQNREADAVNVAAQAEATIQRVAAIRDELRKHEYGYKASPGAIANRLDKALSDPAVEAQHATREDGLSYRQRQDRRAWEGKESYESASDSATRAIPDEEFIGGRCKSRYCHIRCERVAGHDGQHRIGEIVWGTAESASEGERCSCKGFRRVVGRRIQIETVTDPNCPVHSTPSNGPK